MLKTAAAFPLTTAAAASLTASDIQAMTTAQAATLTATLLNAMNAQAFAAMSADQIRAIPPSALAGLSTAQAHNLSAVELGALSAVETAGLSTTFVSAFSAAQVAALNGAGLTAAQVAALTTAETAALTGAEINALTPSARAALKTASISSTAAAGLTATTLAGLSAAQVASFSVAALGALGQSAAAGLTAADIAALGTTGVAGLSPAAVSGLTTAAIAGLTSAEVAAMTTAEAHALSSGQLAAFSAAQAGALTAAELNALATAQIQALHLPALSTTTLQGLTAATLGAMTGAEFASAVGANIGLLATAAVAGLTADEINALSSTQLGALTAAQQHALSAPAAAAYAAAMLANGGSSLLSVFNAQVSNHAISYNGLLTVLQTAATGGMSSAKLAALDQIAGELNATNGVATSAYAQQIFNDVVLGNSANATWTGGAAASTALGNLTATSSQSQVTELVGKWFLGTDLPSFQSESGNIAQGYQTYSEALFAAGGPNYADINQGQLGDCYFLSALATEAEQNPSLLQNMIQSNGNGTYSVLFHVNGKNDYVTVNSQLVALKSGYVMPDGSTMLYDSSTTAIWAPLIEKAYAELTAQTGVVTYGGVGNIDSYAAIGNGGDANGLAAITGQQVIEDYIGGSTSTSTAQGYLKSVQAAFDAHQGVMLADMGANGNFVGDHMYSVVGVNLSAGTVTLHNPWGAAECASAHIQATFTATLSQLAQVGSYLEYTTGALATA